MTSERYLTRDRAYGIWHRTPSLGRFLHEADAASMTMADVDSVLFTEFDYPQKVPLCLVEVARDIGQEKPAGVLQNLAQRADLPAYVVLYTPSDQPNPSNVNWPDIDRFRVRRLWPRPADGWRSMSPEQWARALVRIRAWQLRRVVATVANDSTY